MNESYAAHIHAFGSPKEAALCTPEMAEGLRGHSPDGLIAMWQEVRIGILHNGRFQFCPPDYLQPIVDMVIEQDPELSGGTLTPFGYSAFGYIYGWHSVFGRCDMDVLNKEIVTSMPGNEREKERKPINGPDIEIVINLSGIEWTCDTFDEDGELLFERALAALGPLQRGECYGYFPAIGLGGARNLKYLRRIRALEHFTIIANL